MVQVTREDKGVPAAAELGDDNSPLVWLPQRHITSGNKRNSGRDGTGEITHEKWDLSNLCDEKKNMIMTNCPPVWTQYLSFPQHSLK